MLSGLGHPEQQAAVAHSKKCPSLGYGTTTFIALTSELGAGSNDECHLFWKIPGKKGGDGAALVAQMTNDLGGVRHLEIVSTVWERTSRESFSSEEKDHQEVMTKPSRLQAPPAGSGVSAFLCFKTKTKTRGQC